ncbi:MAG: baseplate J/gp47 family protein [Acidaminococcaceae bacterium]|nr:baseplate J/gp47 family protein [Acidaminococcaceae bacterium]
MYEAREQTEILSELQDHSNVEASKIEGTFEYDVFASNSIEFGKTEIELEQMIKAAFADTSWGEYLTMRCAEMGVDRKPAVCAIGTVTLTGTAGAVVPEGTIVSTESDVYFETTAEMQIGSSGTVDVPVQAQIAGTSGNVAEGTIVKIPMSVPGVNQVTNADATYDGYDEETDASLLARYLLHVRTPGTSGNTYHYREWALSVPGVGDCQVLPLWNGNGTVKVYIVDDNKDAASAELMQRVYDYIETVRPIGATVTIDTPSYMDINVSVRVKVNANYDEDYESVLEDAINAYLEASGFDREYVSIAQIGKVMLNSGAIYDYETLQLNGGIQNVPIPSGYLPRLGTLEVTVDG